MEAEPDRPDGARRRLVLTAGIAIAALAGIVVVALVAAGDEPSDFPEGTVPARQIGDLDRAAEAAGCDARDPDSEGETETGDSVVYRSDPPHSGDHAPDPARDAAYRSGPPSTESLVHSLYHGRVLIWFDPELPQDAIGSLKALYDEDPHHVILVPRESMDADVSATAWTHVLECPRMNDRVHDAIRAFRDTWRDQAPEYVP